MRTEFSILRKDRLAVGLLLFTVAVLPRLPYFNQSLWFDEVYYTQDYLNEDTLRRVIREELPSYGKKPSR